MWPCQPGQEQHGANDTEFSIQANNLAGQPEAAKGDIHVYALKAPAKAFRPRFWNKPTGTSMRRRILQTVPYDLYADESNPYKWERGTEALP